ncbi:Lipoyltransferase and lipoate-protein ligase [Mycena amicta]|nr:Lipoyltransferase and lipoate-protein ligase [Mycena amicta]
MFLRLHTRRPLLKRHLSTLPSTPTHSIYVSRSKDPFLNLSFEDWLFRHAPPDAPLLFLYHNDPCVVIGRNQNPWKEVNLEALRARKVPLVRRRSGGGTVYHDLGNTNFSIHLPRRTFDRKATANIVLRAVRALGIPAARINERNDIYVSSDKMNAYVSGSAYKIVSKRAYHHGTMLLSSRLDMLGDLLHVDKPTMRTAGVASLRAPVTNLHSLNQRATHNNFVHLMIEQFRRVYELGESPFHTSLRETEFWMGKKVGTKKIPPAPTTEENGVFEPQIVEEAAMQGVEDVRRGVEEMQSWDWLYGQTPQFTYTIERTFHWGAVTGEISSKHGRILSCALKLAQADTPSSSSIEPTGILSDIAKTAEGQVYGSWPQLSASASNNNNNKGWPPHLEKDEAMVREDVERWLAMMLR